MLQLESKNWENVLLGKYDKQQNCLVEEEWFCETSMSDPWCVTGRALNTF